MSMWWRQPPYPPFRKGGDFNEGLIFCLPLFQRGIKGVIVTDEPD